MEEEARVEEEQGQGWAEERKESRAGEGGEWGQRRLERKERLVESRARERLKRNNSRMTFDPPEVKGHTWNYCAEGGRAWERG